MKNAAKNVMLPGFARKRHIFVEERMEQLERECSDFDINTIEYQDTDIGIITGGIAYQYVKEAMPQASVLKLGIVNPLPKDLITAFAKKVKQLYIVEELEPVIQEKVQSWGIVCQGKELFARHGEYSVNLIRHGILNEPLKEDIAGDLMRRPPAFCPGCPHRAVFSLLKQMNYHVAGDIGCYTLGALPPFEVIDDVVCMGAGISTLHGMEKAKGSAYIKDWVAVIGDSTFMHTGINGLINMVYNKGTGTVIILDNGTTAMTGHQDHASSGATLQQGEVMPISIAKLCRSLGILAVYTVNAFDTKKMKELLLEAVPRKSVTVIIAQAPCVLRKRHRE